MTVSEAIEKRRARRALAPDPIPASLVDELIAAGTMAPSCFNNQPWRMMTVSGDTALAGVRAALSDGNAWAKAAPLIVVMTTKPSLDCRLEDGRDYAPFDLGLATMALVLKATEAGLIAHPIAGYSPGKVRSALGIPADYVVQTLVIVGYPKSDAPSSDELASNPLLSDAQKKQEVAPRQRKPVSEVAFADYWPQASQK